MKLTFDQAIEEIEASTCFRLTARTDAGSAFFVPVASDGETVVGDCFELSKAKIIALAKTQRKGDTSCRRS